MNVKKQKNNYIWNTIAGIINASEAVILLAVVTRTNGIYDAGILTIAFAIANLLVNIGKFGMRSYQVTDIKEQYNFNTYFASRLFTTTAMLFVIVIYLLYGIQFRQYSLDKAGTILFICLIFTTEAVEDVFAGLFQRLGRLDIAGIIFSMRWVVTILVMILALLLKKNLLIASFTGMIVSVISCMILSICSYRNIWNKPISIDFYGVIPLLINCAPLFMAGFLQFYLINASKYAIDRFLTDDIQACYGFVAMPVFVVGLLNSFLYQPILVQLAMQWEKGDIKGFIRKILVQLGMIAFITIVCLIGADLIGIPVLSVLYHTDLGAYKQELLILLLGGGFLAVIGFITVLLTTMRKQNWILLAYLAASMTAYFFTGQIVEKYATLGAAYAFLISTSILLILLLLVILVTLKNRCLQIDNESKSTLYNR